MLDKFINETIPEALGTAYTNPITGQLPASIEIGQIHNFSKNLHVINKIIAEYNAQNQADFDAMTEEKRSELDINCALKILSYEQYLHFLKLAKTTTKEIRGLYRQQALTIEPYSVDTEHLQQCKNLERRIELAKDTSTPNGIKEAADLVRMGINPKDPQSLRNIRESIKNIERDQKDLERDEMKAMELKVDEKLFRRFNPMKLITFTEGYEITRHTDNLEGYLNYTEDIAPSIFDFIRDVSITADIQESDRQKHTYIVGGSGSGKSELIKIMVEQYRTQNNLAACVVIDPHGDLTEELARRNIDDKDLVYIAPNLQDGYTFRINPLQPPEDSTPEEREVIAQQLVGAFEELLKGGGGSSLTVNMRALILPCLIVLLDAEDKTLIDLQNFLRDGTDEKYIKLGEESNRPAIARFFKNDFKDKLFSITKQSLRTKLQSLFNTETFYNVVNGKTTIDLETLINQKKIILFNLSKGDIGADVSEALGRFIIALLQGIAMRRQKQAKEERTPVHLFIDECQNYIGTSTITILEEARKYGVYLTLAQQVAGRGMSPEIRTVTFNNTNIKIMGRTPDDKRMAGIIGIETEDAQQLATGEFYCKAGNKPPFKFKAHTYLVKDMEASEDYYMSGEEFNIVKQNQIKQFYTPIIKEEKNTSKRELI